MNRRYKKLDIGRKCRLPSGLAESGTPPKVSGGPFRKSGRQGRIPGGTSGERAIAPGSYPLKVSVGPEFMASVQRPRSDVEKKFFASYLPHFQTISSVSTVKAAIQHIRFVELNRFR